MGDCRKDDDRLLLAGEFTIEHAAGLKDFLSAAALVGGPALVDLSGVTRADISLFQLLVAYARTLESAGIQARITGLNEYLSSQADASGVRKAMAPHIPEGG